MGTFAGKSMSRKSVKMKNVRLMVVAKDILEDASTSKSIIDASFPIIVLLATKSPEIPLKRS